MPRKYTIALLILFLCVLAYLSLFALRGADFRLQTANDSYLQGEAAQTVGERKTAFNRALQLYLELENEYQPIFGNGKLYYDIGNTYFQLQSYPRAILYYQRALALMPRSERAYKNLSLAQDKLGLANVEEKQPFAQIFFFHFFLSLPERLQVFFGLSAMALVLCSAWIWKPRLWLGRSAVVFLFLMGVMLASVLYTHYFSAIEGIALHSVNLRRDAGMQYAQVLKEPIPAGSKLEIIGASQEGHWLKVVTAQGEMGYVPQNVVSLIQEIEND